MILYVDSESKVRAVDSTTDDTLTPLYVDENNESFPFEGWSTAKICCYMVTVEDGVVTMMTPYVDSRMLDSIDAMGHQIDNAAPWTASKEASHGETEVTFEDVPEGALTAYVRDMEGHYLNFTINRDGATLTVYFEPLEYAAEIKISIN